MLKTYDVKLTRASNAAQSYTFLLEKGADGAYGVQLGSTEDEADSVGRRGVIQIKSFHNGSGQYIARDPEKYEFADGMLADVEGRVRTRGAAALTHTLATAAPHVAWLRGAIVVQPEIINDDHVFITPRNIYQGSTIRIANVSGQEFNGSYAVFGERTFFAASNALGLAGFVAMRNANTASWNANVGWRGSLLASETEKMWVIEQTGNRVVAYKWADDTSTNAPPFAASYVASLGRVRDLCVLGAHAVSLVRHPDKRGTSLIALDVDGLFTPLMSDISPAGLFTPFLGGQIVMLGGGSRALWLPDVGSFRTLGLDGVSPMWAPDGMAWPRYLPGSWAYPLGAQADSLESELFFSLYGRSYARDGTLRYGSSIYQAILADQGVIVHQIASPEGVSALRDAYVMGLGIGHKSSGQSNLWGDRHLVMMLAKPNTSNAAQSDITVHNLFLWEDSSPPDSLNRDGSTKFIRSSRYEGEHWVTKHFTKMRGVAKGEGTLTVKLYVDGGTTAVYTKAIIITPAIVNFINFDIPAANNVLGRLVAFDFETTSPYLTIELPWELEFFAVPSAQDQVRLRIQAGMNDIDTMGGPNMDTRANVLLAVEALVDAGDRWTLDWWDDMPAWSVIPLSYSSAEREGQHAPATGAATVELLLQRVT